MKPFALGLALLFFVIPATLLAYGCPEGYSDCGSDLCCPTMTVLP